jgi:hypothetical protein
VETEEGDTWQRGQWTQDPSSREHHVNFDLSTQPDSSTHTDNEGSDSGIGTQDWGEPDSVEKSAAANRRASQQAYGPPPHPPVQQPPSQRSPPHSNASVHPPQQYQAPPATNIDSVLTHIIIFCLRSLVILRVYVVFTGGHFRKVDPNARALSLSQRPPPLPPWPSWSHPRNVFWRWKCSGRRHGECSIRYAYGQ